MFINQTFALLELGITPMYYYRLFRFHKANQGLEEAQRKHQILSDALSIYGAILKRNKDNYHLIYLSHNQRYEALEKAFLALKQSELTYQNIETAVKRVEAQIRISEEEKKKYAI